MHSQLEQARKTYSTEFSCGLIEFDSDWQRIFVTALIFHLDQAILDRFIFSRMTDGQRIRQVYICTVTRGDNFSLLNI